MNREELKQLMPHREPMLLVDESEIIDESHVESKYTIRENEFFTTGHFPGYPVVPGVILCEIMAQGGVRLISEDELKAGTAFYAAIDNAKFKNSVFPGDTVVTTAHLAGRKGPAVFIDAKATVNGKLCCSGKLTFMIVPNDKLYNKA